MPDNFEQTQREVKSIIESGPQMGEEDWATRMLSELFGDGWWELLWSGKGITGEPSLIMPILQAFNILMLVGVSLILIYVAVHAFVGSAHEGTPLGRRLHSIWVPVRSVLSIALLAPLPTAPALNVIQGIVLCFVGFSISFANTAMDKGISYLAQNYGQVAVSVPQNLPDTGTEIAKVALNNYLIQYHQYWFQKNDWLETGYEKDIRDPLSQRIRGFFGGDSYTDIHYRFRNPEPFSEDVMGSVTVRCKELESDLCNARQRATEGLLAWMEDAAAKKVEELYGEDTSPPSQEEVLDRIDQYASSLDSAIRRIISADNPAFQQELTQFQNAISDQGFVLLGSYYWTMSRFSMALQDQVNAETTARD